MIGILNDSDNIYLYIIYHKYYNKFYNFRLHHNISFPFILLKNIKLYTTLPSVVMGDIKLRVTLNGDVELHVALNGDDDLHVTVMTKIIYALP